MTEKSKAVLPDIASKKDDTVTIKRGVSPNQSLIQPSYVKEQDSIDINLTSLKPLNYKNGRKIEPSMFNYANYYSHREQLPRHYHPLVQYLESTELKYHNDNLFENSPTGFPTRAQYLVAFSSIYISCPTRREEFISKNNYYTIIRLLKEKVKHLPIVNSTAADKARYKRKLEENQKNILMLRKKYEFKTYDDHSSHYFLTGARFNRLVH